MNTDRELIDGLRVARERAEKYVAAQLATMGVTVTPAKRIELVLSAMRAAGVTTKKCPECGYPLLKTRRLCVTCGTDELTTEQVEQRLNDAPPIDVDRIATFVEDYVKAYPEDVFVPGGCSPDAIAADTLRKMLPTIAREIREGAWRNAQTRTIIVDEHAGDVLLEALGDALMALGDESPEVARKYREVGAAIARVLFERHGDNHLVRAFYPPADRLRVVK